MQNPYEKYKQQSVMTMTGADLVNLLFETAEKRLNTAVICINQKNYEGANTACKKAQDIFTHLSVTLDEQYEISGQLAALYDYFIYNIRQANIKKDTGPIEEIIPLIIELQESFRQADKNIRIQTSTSSVIG